MKTQPASRTLLGPTITARTSQAPTTAQKSAAEDPTKTEATTARSSTARTPVSTAERNLWPARDAPGRRGPGRRPAVCSLRIWCLMPLRVRRQRRPRRGTAEEDPPLPRRRAGHTRCQGPGCRRGPRARTRDPTPTSPHQTSIVYLFVYYLT